MRLSEIIKTNYNLSHRAQSRCMTVDQIEIAIRFDFAQRSTQSDQSSSPFQINSTVLKNDLN